MEKEVAFVVGTTKSRPRLTLTLLFFESVVLVLLLAWRVPSSCAHGSFAQTPPFVFWGVAGLEGSSALA